MRLIRTDDQSQTNAGNPEQPMTDAKDLIGRSLCHAYNAVQFR